MGHNRLLVTVDRERVEDSLAARRTVYRALAELDGFLADEEAGRDGVADWFVIGGRGSGLLSRLTWARGVVAANEALEVAHGLRHPQFGLRVFGPAGPPDPAAARRVQAQAEEWYQQAMPAALRGHGLTYHRSPYDPVGAWDDAMLLSAELYAALLQRYEDAAEQRDEFGFPRYLALAGEPVSRAMIGRKWLVVVVYHD